MTQQTYTPDWSKAPPQANWWARDKDGSGFWYSNRPSANRRSFFINGGFVLADNDCPFINCSFELDNWQSTLTERPRQNCDIPQNLSDYFTGKTPFITAYVDLLLARMAHTQSFSDDDELVTFFEPFDVITFEDYGVERKNFAVVQTPCVTTMEHMRINFNIAQDTNGNWSESKSIFPNVRTFNFRTITELEAVEFRAAMEAVYG